MSIQIESHIPKTGLTDSLHKGDHLDSSSFPVETQIAREALAAANQYDLPNKFLPELAVLVESGVLGQEAMQAKWDNVGEHCIRTFHLASVLCNYIGLPEEQTQDICSSVLLHDYDIRKTKTGYGKEVQGADGLTRIQASTQYFIDHESSHEGMRQPTSMDWRDRANWDIGQKIMRYVDSCSGAREGGGRDEYMHWHERIRLLKKNKADADAYFGETLYGGFFYEDENPSAFDYLEWVVMPEIEQELYELIQTRNPNINFESSQLFYKLVDEVPAQFQTPSQPHYDTVPLRQLTLP